MRYLHNKLSWGPGGNLLILVLLIVLHLLHIPNDINNSLNDFLGRHVPPSIQPEQRSLVVECRPEHGELGDDTWLNLVDQLEERGAAQILFLFFPEGVTSKFYSHTARYNNIYFGRFLSAPDTATAVEHSPIPPEAKGYPLQVGAIDIPPPRKGVYRNQYSIVSAQGGEQLPHIVRLSVERRNLTADPVDETFIVNFNGRATAHKQPRMSLEQALSGNLVESLVGGRTVIIGMRLTDYYTGLRTPMASDSELISPALYTAYAYDSLLHNKTLHNMGPLLACLVIVVFILTGSVVAQYLRFGFALISFFFAFVIAWIAGWASLYYLLLKMPLVEIFIGQFLTLMLAIAGKSLLTEETLSQLAFNTKLEVQERLMPDNIYDSPQYWAQIVGMVSQVLNLDRSIFLEKIPGDHRVREVAATNTSIDDIVERRRDFQRAPYTTALEADEVVEVKRYLTPSEHDERQFLVPLKVTEDGVLGFWACSVSADRDDITKDLLPLINTFAEQISEMLYGRERWLLEQDHQQHPLRNLLAFGGGQGRSAEIHNAFSMLSRRLSTVETVFDSMGTGAILYDLFGQVVYANRKITSLCRELEVSPYNLTGAELIVELTDRNLDDVRQMLADIIFSENKVHYSTRKLGEQQTIYMLTISTVGADQEHVMEPGNEPAHAFNVLGLLLEVHEMTNVEKILRYKNMFLNLSSRSFNNYEVSLAPVLELLKQEDLLQPTREKLIRFMENRHASLFGYIRILRKLMTRDMLTSDTPYYPTDCEECLQIVVKNLGNKAASRKIEFAVSGLDYMVPVFAIPEELETLFQDLLLYLLADAKPSSSLILVISREHKFVVCHLKNEGYGMPDHDFQNYLDDKETALSQEFRALHNARTRLIQFGGAFSARSELGKGTEFIIKLKQFE